MTLDTQSLRPLFTEWARIMEANKSVLTELDSVVGDGDLGLTMSDGFAAAARYAQQSEERDLGRFFYMAGKAMASAVPSTMGTLMASGLMQAGKAFKGRETLGLTEAGVLFQAWYDGVQQRGKAQPGEKNLPRWHGPRAGGAACRRGTADRGEECATASTTGRAADNHHGGEARACSYSWRALAHVCRSWRHGRATVDPGLF